MSSKTLKSIDDLVEESDQYAKQYSELDSRSPNDPGCAKFVDGLRSWLLTCLEHGKFFGSGSPERRSLRALVDEWDSRLQRDGHRLAGLDRLAAFDPDAGVVLESDCPYPGLDAYRADRAASFFGRGALADAYVERLLRSRIFLILGASGSGKSSLAMAGVRPKLKASYPEWVYPDDFTPGNAPLTELARVVATHSNRPAEAQSLAGALRTDTSSAPRLFAHLCGGRPMLLVVDQFEELFTLCRDDGERAAFANVLLALSEPSKEVAGWACYTLITLRTDHLARFENNDAQKPLYVRLVDERNAELLTSLTFEDIKRAVAEPAKNCGLRFSPPSIIDSLASQTAGLVNGLPLLQFALRRLWDTRPREAGTERPLDLVTQSMVDALPDVQRSLGKVAEEIYVGLTQRQKEICKRALLELVLLDENFEAPLRRRRDRQELQQVLANQFDNSRDDIAVVEHEFIEAGLLRTFGEGAVEQIEVSHEALLRHWERINNIVSGEDAKRRLHTIKQIGREATEWAEHGRRDDFRKQQGEPLKAARSLIEQGWVADTESKEYIAACEERQKDITGAVAMQKRLKKIAAAAVLGSMLLILGLGYIKMRKDAALTAVAALSERLPPGEGLDVAYSLADRLGHGYRYALAHALERMEDSWLLGERDARLFPAGDGSALLQFWESGVGQNKQRALSVYLLNADGSPKTAHIDVSQDEGLLFRQGEVGPEIGQGPNAGKHLLVLALSPEGEPSESLKAYLLDPVKGEFTKLVIEGEVNPLPPGTERSPIRIHPEGDKAVWSVIDYPSNAPGDTRFASAIQELRVVDAKVASVQSTEPAAADPPSPVTAVAYYGLDPADKILGRLNGSVDCDSRTMRGDSTPPIAGSAPPPIFNIVTNEAVFAATNRGGQVYVGSCSHDDSLRILQDPSSDPSSLRLAQVEREVDKTTWVVSYVNSDGQMRCYEYDPARKQPHQPVSWACNAAHSVGSAVVITRTGNHVVVDRSDVNLIRRYPNEELSRDDRRVNARHANGTTLRWTSDAGLGLKEDKEDNDGRTIPWKLEDSDITAEKGRKIVSAALSPNGKRIVWIEQLKRGDTEFVAWVSSGELRATQSRTELLPREPLPRQGGFATAVAIDNSGNIAHVQQRSPEKQGLGTSLEFSSGQRPIPLVGHGKVKCMAFSPNGKFLVVGMGLSLQRVNSGGSPGLTRLLREGRTKNVDLTSCAVSDDGAVAAGYADGQVGFFDGKVVFKDSRDDVMSSKGILLTARAVYALPVLIKDVRIEPPGRPTRRVTALGASQQVNCVHAALPGQSLRAWDVMLPEKERGTPVAAACFPNATIAAIGEWGDEADKGTRSCPKAGDDAKLAGPDLCLITARGSRWHSCVGCGSAGKTRSDDLAAVLCSAKRFGAKKLSDDDLDSRYGFKLGPLPFWHYLRLLLGDDPSEEDCPPPSSASRPGGGTRASAPPG